MENWALVAGGLVLLLGGGEMLVRGAVAAAVRLGVSPLMIGLTLVGFGTSTPELVASLRAALDGAPAVALGNVVGSNIANVLLILGVAALLSPMIVERRSFARDGAVLVAASLLLTGLVLADGFGAATGAALLLLVLGYTWFVWKTDSAAGAALAGEVPDRPALGLGAGLSVAAAGITGVVIGAGLLVDGAVALARAAGLSEAVIGLTLVAVGTSLPELVTSIVAALKRQGAVAFGNVIGSNIFNVLGILGVTALAAPLPVPAEIARLDIWVMLGAAVALTLFAVTGWRLSRCEGAALLAAYAVYLGVLVLPAI
ncbi:sodium:calcium antiporter [Rhodosalinus halophilus]|uniref:Sodium:calcium antiporter n=1 Tax=Rhodosalinus halophilus TaxID=2259333 RepID=A0A365U932_9RHOB|nr:calcium/sodium antiporter [Rhodosalinus halophilus]RBI85464.1 sodium:calcium antiporter [Rhodosalinus halophilus]